MQIVAEEKIEQEFHVSWFIVGYKLVFGLVELLSGVGIAIFGKKLLDFYTAQLYLELSEDPHDLLATVSERFVPNLLAHHTSLVFYLVLLGAAKIAGAIGLMYKQHWGVDLLVGLTMLMFPFQMVNLVIHPSLSDGIYIVVGLLIALYLINYKPRQWARRMVRHVRK
jgi:uncharacterized membrane protein